jgi:hypothetical protein
VNRRQSSPLLEAEVERHLAWEQLARELGEQAGEPSRWGWASAWGLTEVQRLCVESAFARGDMRRAVAAVRDFRAYNRLPQIQIEKFSPGEHFYVGRDKFGSFEQAARHASLLGYRVLPGVRVTSMSELLLEARAVRQKKEGP